LGGGQGIQLVSKLNHHTNTRIIDYEVSWETIAHAMLRRQGLPPLRISKRVFFEIQRE
jgi:hypothetical protein